MQEEIIKLQRADRTSAFLIVAVIAIVLGLIAFTGASAMAQDQYYLGAKINGTVLKGQDYNKVTEVETFIVTMNANKRYEIAFEGENVTVEIDGTTFSSGFNIIEITTDKVTTIHVSIKPTEKKGKCSIVVSYLGKVE